MGFIENVSAIPTATFLNTAPIPAGADRRYIWDADYINRTLTALQDLRTRAISQAVWITECGAVGDGVTDCVVPIREAIAKAAQQKVGVYVPPCKVSYRCDGSGLGAGQAMFTMVDRLSIWGSGILSPLYITGASSLSRDDDGYYNDWVTFRVLRGGYGNAWDRLYFVGENGAADGASYLKVDQGQHACIEFEASTLGDNTRDCWIRYCEFWNLYGFAAHAPGQVRRVHMNNCKLRWLGNGVNLNAVDSMQDNNDLSECEGFENAGSNFSISGNTLRNIWGTAVSAGGQSTPGYFDRGGVVCKNNISKVYDGHGIFFSDGVCLSQAKDNYVEKCFGFGMCTDDSGSGIARTQNYGNDLDSNTVVACGFVTSAPQWTPNAAARVGDQCLNAETRVYLCTAGGTTATSGGPVGTGDAINDNGVIWRYLRTTKAYTAGLTVALGDPVVRGGNMYLAVRAGITSGPGPTGAVQNTQTCGTAKFRFLHAGTASPNAVGMKCAGGSGTSGQHSISHNRIYDGNLIAARQDANTNDLDYANYRMGTAIGVGGNNNHVIGNRMLTYGLGAGITTSGTVTGLVEHSNVKLNDGLLLNAPTALTRAINEVRFRTNTDIVMRFMRYDDAFAQWDIDGRGKQRYGAEGSGSGPDLVTERMPVGGGGAFKITGFGVVLPNLTSIQRDALSGQAPGHTVFNTTTGKLECWDGTVWRATW